MKRIYGWVFVLSVVGLTATAALSEELPSAVQEAQKIDPTDTDDAYDNKEFAVRFSTKHDYETDSDDTTGEISTTVSKLELAFDDKFSGRLPVSFNFDYKHTELEESFPLELPSHLEGAEFGFGTKFPIPFVDIDNFYIGLDVKPSMYTDDGKFTSSAFRMPVRTYLIYRETDDFIWVAGVSIRPDFDDDLLPIFGFKYIPNEQWSFNFLSTDPTIEYKACEKVTLLAEGGFVNDEYEVTHNGVEGTVLKYEELSVGAGLKYHISDDMYAQFGTGVVFGRDFEYLDGSGDVEPEAALYSRFKFEAKF